MYQRPGLHRKRILVYLGTCLMAAHVVLPRWGAAPPNHLAGWEGLLRGSGTRGE